MENYTRFQLFKRRVVVLSGSMALCLFLAPTSGLKAHGRSAKQAAAAEKQDTFDRAGKASATGLKKSGEATEKGLSATGTGLGAAVEHTGRGSVAAVKAPAKGATAAATATFSAAKATGGLVAGIFGSRSEAESYDTPDQIRAAEQALKSERYYQGAIDGIAGPGPALDFENSRVTSAWTSRATWMRKPQRSSGFDSCRSEPRTPFRFLGGN